MGKKKTQEQFLEDCFIVHGDRYDYSLVEYNGAFVDVIISCKLHGQFKQRPDTHINGKRGCPTCGRLSSSNNQKKHISPESAISRLTEVHKNRYSYLIGSSITQKSYIDVVCKAHGVFTQRYDHHLNGSGCKKCQYEKLRSQFSLDRERFIKSAQDVHGSKYDYSHVDYFNSQSKVKILCMRHGIFEQQANSHLQGCGCPSCGEYGYDPYKNGTFYILGVGDKYLKFGITNNFNRRLKEISTGSSFEVNKIYTFNFEDGYTPLEIERLVKLSIKDKAVVDKSCMSTGHTETTYLTNLSNILDIINSFTNNTS